MLQMTKVEIEMKKNQISTGQSRLELKYLTSPRTTDRINLSETFSVSKGVYVSNIEDEGFSKRLNNVCKNIGMIKL